MIIYFSATGNDKYIAERTAAATGEETVSIAERCRTGQFEIEPANGEALGFVSPVYFWGLPSIVKDFLKKMTVKDAGGGHYVYGVLTFGSFTGAAHTHMARLLKKKGLKLQARFAVRMVDTWTPLFNCADPEKNRQKTEAAEPKIDRVIERIKEKAEGRFNTCGGLVLCSSIAQLLYQAERSTKKFRVKDSCIGCGLCADQCPVQAIEMKNERPVWVKDRCCLCLGCLHRCPKNSILYGHMTEGKGQFVNPKTKL